MNKKRPSNFVISVLVIAALALGNAGSTLYLPAMPSIASNLHATGSMIQLSLSLFLLGFSLSQLFYGPLSDAFGRRINLNIGLFLFVIGSFISSIASDVGSLLIGRLIEGLGIGATGAVGYSLMRDIYSGNRLTIQFSYISICVGMMPLIAPLVGGYLVTDFGWRSCFYLLTTLSVILLICKLLWLPETLTEKNPTAFHPSVMVKNYKTLLFSSEFIGAAGIAAFGFSGIFTTGSILPFLLVNQLGIPPSLYGWIAGIPALGYLLGAFISGRMSIKIPLLNLIVFGASFSFISLGIGCIANLSHFTVISLIVPLLFFMFGVGFLVPTGSSAAMAPFPKLAGSEAALLTAFMFSAASMLTAIGSVLHITSPIPLFGLLACTSVVALLFSWGKQK